jgi:hypothetical protein
VHGRPDAVRGFDLSKIRQNKAEKIPAARENRGDLLIADYFDWVGKIKVERISR